MVVQEDLAGVTRILGGYFFEWMDCACLFTVGYNSVQPLLAISP